MTKFAYNNKQHLSTGELLFLINPGRYPSISGRKANEVMKRRADKK